MLKILHLEDDATDRILIAELLSLDGISANISYAQNSGEFEVGLAASPDLVLADQQLPAFDGLTALRATREHDPFLPFIFVSGSMGEEAAVETIKQGATDYILKDRLSRLPQAIRRALHETKAARQARKDQARLREQATMLENARDAILVCDLDGTIREWNQGAKLLYGWLPEEAKGKRLETLLPACGAPVFENARRDVSRLGRWIGEIATVNRNGDKTVTESRWTLIPTGQRESPSILIISTDISERKKLEEQVLRAQRLESIGILSGGIAHDLNNILSPILLGAQLLRSEIPEGRAVQFLDTIESAANHGAELVQQILTFARGAGGEVVEIHVEQLARETCALLRGSISKRIKIDCICAPDLWPIRAVPTQIRQVLMNLCINARDAMPKGGQLSLRLQNETIDNTRKEYEIAPGPYVTITVSDTGCGISPDLIEKIYQPFFTTKAPEKGTGLGLSTVRGIVTNHGGFIHLSSEPGKGTTFHIFLPATARCKIHLDSPSRGGIAVTS